MDKEMIKEDALKTITVKKAARVLHEEISKMVDVTVPISKEDYEQAKEKGAMSLITNPSLIYGYGVYGASVTEVEGRYYLSYNRGDSCD